jgi:hypothetical protein
MTSSRIRTSWRYRNHIHCQVNGKCTGVTEMSPYRTTKIITTTKLKDFLNSSNYSWILSWLTVVPMHRNFMLVITTVNTDYISLIINLPVSTCCVVVKHYCCLNIIIIIILFLSLEFLKSTMCSSVFVCFLQVSNKLAQEAVADCYSSSWINF